MSIRRPPTALGLTATDVAEVSAKIKQERQARLEQQHAEREGAQLVGRGQDALVETERREREMRERMSRDERIGL